MSSILFVLKDDPMQVWLDKCTFRRKKITYNAKQHTSILPDFHTLHEELDAYEDAIDELFGIERVPEKIEKKVAE